MALSDNLIHYWKLDGNSSDSIGAQSGTDSNITYSTTNALIGQRAGFSSGSFSRIIMNGYTPTLTNFSLSLWFYVTSTSFSQRLVGTRNGSGWEIITSGTKIDIYGNNGSNYFIETTNDVILNNWNHIVITDNGTNLYLNGTPTNGSIPVNANSNLTFGIYAGDLFTGPFNGNQDEIGIWSRSLTSAEVTTLYNGGAGITTPFPSPLTSNASFLNLMV